MSALPAHSATIAAAAANEFASTPGDGTGAVTVSSASSESVVRASSFAQFLALFRRELAGAFLAPMSYLVWAVFLIASGYLFATSVRDGAPANLDGTFMSMGLLLLFVCPLLTMRLIAEERKQGTLELLLTDPTLEALVVTSKYAAALAVFTAMLMPTLAYPLVLAATGQPDLGPVVSGYVGLWLLGGLFLAVGLLASSLTQNQIAAASLSFTVLLLLWALARAADNVAPGMMHDVLAYVSAFTRFSDFLRGLVDSRALVYFVSGTALCLYGTRLNLGLVRLR